MDHLAGFRDHSAQFLELASRAPADRQVTTCPDWTVDDLVFHLGSVWDRFARIADERLTHKDEIRGLAWAERPADDTVAWAAACRRRLLEALAGLGPDEPVWNFTRAPHVGAWVPRRMHHETAMHRWDLADTLGVDAPIDPVAAADGVDELVTVLSTAGQRWERDRAVVLEARSEHPDGAWAVRLEPGERGVPVAPGHSDVVVSGRAPDLLLAAWRRRPLTSVRVDGDAELARAALTAIGR